MATATNDESSADGALPSGGYVAGTVIAKKYELTRSIGEGGMGAVWLARNRSLQIDVAIKLIRRADSTDDHCARLLQEAQSAARIEHPCVVRIFDFGETEHGDPFIVMELLRGEDLRDFLHREKRAPADDAVPMLLCVASALVSAHAKGIVHRDLKPENVFLVPGEDGVVVPKVVDFGIAKVVDRERETGRVITRSGVLVGSPDYMSPEQARGAQDLDARTDVWSLCVVLYELLTGKMPFEGDSYGALIASIMVEPPTPTTALLAGDRELWEILAKGLAKAPQDRWQTMRELGKELAAWCVAHDIETDAAGASIARHWLSSSKRNLARPSLSGLDTTPPPPSGPQSGRGSRDSLPGGPISNGPVSDVRDITAAASLPDIRRSTGVSVMPSSKPVAGRLPIAVVIAVVALALGVLVVLLSKRSVHDESATKASAVPPPQPAATVFEPAPAPAPAATAAPIAEPTASVTASASPSALPHQRSFAPKSSRPNRPVAPAGKAGMPVPKEAPF